jgi:hypothetical protein
MVVRHEKASLRHEDIGGGKVKQAFRSGATLYRPGMLLTAEQIMAWPYPNRCALIDRFIEVWPKEARLSPILEGEISHFVVHIGAGRFNVIKGVVLNDEPLDKEQAKELKARAEAQEAAQEPAPATVPEPEPQRESVG